MSGISEISSRTFLEPLEISRKLETFGHYLFRVAPKQRRRSEQSRVTASPRPQAPNPPIRGLLAGVKEESVSTRSNQFPKTCYPEQIQAGPSTRMRYIYETKGPPTITMGSPKGGVTLSSRCRALRTIPAKRANLPVLIRALEKRVTKRVSAGIGGYVRCLRWDDTFDVECCPRLASRHTRTLPEPFSLCDSGRIRVPSLNRMDDLTSHSEVVHRALCRQWKGATVITSSETIVALIRG
jgi:hypothetical protein